MRAEKVNLGLVGAGAIAQTYVEAARECDLVRIIGVADTREEARRAAATHIGCKSYETHDELINNESCDAVLVCTPPASHYQICLDLIAGGIPVLCEKPLCIDVASARHLVDAAESAGVILTMASKFRYVDDITRAKHIVDAGLLGEIVLFENTFTSRVDMSKRWNSDPVTSGGGVLIDNGTHSVDIMRYFLGPISQVMTVEGKRIQRLPVEDTVRIFVRSIEGVMGSIDLSWSLHKELDSYVDIYGAQGTLRVGWRESRYRQASSSDWVTFGSGYNKIEAMRNQLMNFCRAVRGEEPLRITAEDAIASVEVVQTAYESLNRTDWILVQSGSNGGDGRSTMTVEPAASRVVMA